MELKTSILYALYRYIESDCIYVEIIAVVFVVKVAETNQTEHRSKICDLSGGFMLLPLTRISIFILILPNDKKNKLFLPSTLRFHVATGLQL